MGVDGHCPQNCTVAAWADWSHCSTSCGGGGTRTRTRRVTDEAHYGGLCTDPLSWTQRCSLQVCPPTECEWAPWHDWVACSRTCDGGIKTRSRTVAHEATNGGGLCAGDTSEVSVCSTQECPILDCTMSSWSKWTHCSATCGAGTRTRHREILTPSHGTTGHCSGDLRDVQECHAIHCNVMNWHASPGVTRHDEDGTIFTAPSRDAVDVDWSSVVSARRDVISISATLNSTGSVKFGLTSDPDDSTDFHHGMHLDLPLSANEFQNQRRATTVTLSIISGRFVVYVDQTLQPELGRASKDAMYAKIFLSPESSVVLIQTVTQSMAPATSGPHTEFLQLVAGGVAEKAAGVWPGLLCVAALAASAAAASRLRCCRRPRGEPTVPRQETGYQPPLLGD